MEEAEKIRQLAMREKPLGMMESFNGGFMKFSHMVFSVKALHFSPCEHFSKIYVTQTALRGDLRGHMGAIG